MRQVLGKYGIEESYAYSSAMLTMEMSVVLVPETASILVCSAALSFFVVAIISGGPRIGMIVTLSIILMNFFLLALVPLVGLTFNNVVLVYLITSIGISVLYSA